jgi:glycosyltransferase involved in cell wall biosynthesis
MDVDRVVFVAVSEVLGGGERYLLRTAEAASSRVDTAVAGAPGTPVLRAARKLGLRTVDLPLGRKLGRRTALSNAPRFPGAQRRLRQFIARADRAEWTVLQYKWEQLLWAGHPAPERVAMWEHGPIPSALLANPWTRRRLRRAFSSAGAVFAWSAPARAAIERLSDRQPVTLEAGIDPARAEAAMATREPTRRRLGVDPGVPLLTFAGRLFEDKGVAELIGALPCLPGARAVICGDGPERRRLERLASDLGVADRTLFMGYVDDPLPPLAAADVAVLLSSSPGEGRPLVAVEAGALGTPVLALAGSTALEHLVAEGGARLVTDTDPGTVARGVEAALRQPRKVIGAPSWEETADRFLEALRGRQP